MDSPHSARSGLRGWRIVAANWDVKELVAHKSEIVAKNELTMVLVGKPGMEHSEAT